MSKAEWMVPSRRSRGRPPSGPAGLGSEKKSVKDQAKEGRKKAHRDVAGPAAPGLERSVPADSRRDLTEERSICLKPRL